MFAPLCAGDRQRTKAAAGLLTPHALLLTAPKENSMKQIQEAYIVAATRTPVAKRNGMFRNVRPDDMLAHVLSAVVAKVPGLDATEIGDVVVGCAMPEAEQ